MLDMWQSGGLKQILELGQHRIVNGGCTRERESSVSMYHNLGMAFEIKTLPSSLACYRYPLSCEDFAIASVQKC